MATVAPPPQVPKKPGASSGAKVSGADRLIEDRIEEAQRALWWAELVRSTLTLAIVGILVLLTWLVVDQWIYSPGMLARLLISLGLLGMGSWYVFRRVLPLLRSSIRPEYAARSLERDLPELRQSLTSYVTLRTDRSAGDLRSRVVRSIGSSTAGKLQSHEALPAEATGTFRWWIATAVAFAMLAGYVVATPKNSLQTVARLAAPIASIDPARRVTIEEVLPGDIDAIAGRAVAVSASVDGIKDDEEVICVWDLASGRKSSVLSIDSDSGRHQGEIWIPHSASGSVRYTIAAGDAEAGPFRLRVQDLPVVALESVRYEPPAYTRQPPHTSSSGAITALDGTTVQILATTNRPVAKGKIEFNPRKVGDRVRATAGATQMSVAENGTSLSVSFPVRTAKGRSAAVELEGYRITVTDASGQTNPEPIIYPIRVVSDLAPEVSITMPFRSPKEVPIDAQQIIEVHGSDPDYGLREIRLEVRAGIELIAEPVLWSHPEGKPGNQVAEYRFRPQEHDLQIGATVQIVAVATDNRSSETDTRLEPNVTVTDPVELKITASAPLPEQNDPNAGGLSEPDDRPASDHQESSGDEGGNEGGEGEEQGGGGGGSGGEGESGESQSGQNDSGDSTSQSGNGESESEGGGGSGANSDDREGDGNQSDDSGSGNASDTSSGDSGGNPSGGEGDSNQSENKGSEPANSDPANDSSTDGSATNDSGGTGDSNAQPMNQDGNSGSQDQNTDGSSNDSTTESGAEGTEESSGGSSSNSNANNTENGNEPSGGDPDSSEPRNSEEGSGDREPSGDQSNSENTGSSSEAGNSAQDSGQQGSPDNASSGDEPASNPEGGNSDSDGQPKQAPKHDGEAFERMRDYLEKKQQEGRDQRGNDRSDQGSQEQSPSSNGGQESSSGERSDSGSSEESSSGAGADEQQNSNSTDGSESTDGTGDSSQDSAGDERGSEESAGDGAGDSEGRGSESQTGEEGSQDSSRGSESNTGESSSAESSSGDSSNDNTDSGSESNAAEGETTPRSADESNSSSESSSDPNEGASESQSNSPSSDAASDQSNRNSNASPSQSGTGEGSDLGESAESSVPPDPVNVEYAKKATDMVLDYLDETRDVPDQDLLDELNWSEEDLKRFAERWQKVRQMESAAPGEKRELEDALKSLGMRDRSGRTTEIRESGDALRNIRDSGNRKPPPAAYRDAFDAFRRAMGRSR